MTRRKGNRESKLEQVSKSDRYRCIINVTLCTVKVTDLLVKVTFLSDPGQHYFRLMSDKKGGNNKSVKRLLAKMQMEGALQKHQCCVFVQRGKGIGDDR